MTLKVPFRVLVSVPVDGNLTQIQREIRDSVYERLRRRGLAIEEFFYKGRSLGQPWSLPSVETLLDDCVGALVLAFARLPLSAPPFPTDSAVPTPWNHIEGALARARGLPTLVIAEYGVHDGGIVNTGLGHSVVRVRTAADLKTEEARVSFKGWENNIKARPHVFLGYCGSSAKLADHYRTFLTRDLGLVVRDWRFDFGAGRTILEEIARAGRECAAGVFLLTEDDLIDSKGGLAFAPRDNVVFEIGYFARARGTERTLLIRQNSAKVPADLGGVIFLQLDDLNNPSALHDAVRANLRRMLAAK